MVSETKIDERSEAAGPEIRTPGVSTADRIASFLKLHSIQGSITLALLFMVVIAIVFMGLTSYTVARRAILSTAHGYTGELITQIRTSIDTYIANMESIAEVIHRDANVQNYLRAANADDHAESGRFREPAASLLNSISQTRDDISLLMVYGGADRVLFHDPQMRLNEYASITDQDWFTAAQEARGGAAVSGSHVQNAVADRYQWVITLSREIRDDEDNVSLGMLLVDLNFRVIEELASAIELGERGYVFIVAENGDLVYHPQQQLIYSNLREERIAEVLAAAGGSFSADVGGAERLYTVDAESDTNWKIVGVNYIDELVLPAREIQVYFVLFGILCFFLIILLSLRISVRISKPIQMLRESMKSVERGDFDIQVEVRGRTEVADLSRDFNIMISEIRALMKSNAQKQDEKRRSELRALQNQITPHFMYNTLDSIIWMAEGREYDKVITMTSALGRLLRLSISHGDELVTVANEIEHVTNYLRIQQMRYADRLDYSIEVDQEVRRLTTLKVILQPLVENAIYHGLRNQYEGGRIRIRAYADTDLVFTVTDNGVGMAQEYADALLAANGDGRQPEAQNGRGVGVRNVRDRIQLYFGVEYGLRFYSEPDEGTTVEVRQPLLHSEEPAVRGS